MSTSRCSISCGAGASCGRSWTGGSSNSRGRPALDARRRHSIGPPPFFDYAGRHGRLRFVVAEPGAVTEQGKVFEELVRKSHAEAVSRQARVPIPEALIVPWPEVSRALARAIQRLLKDPGLRLRMGQAARRRVLDLFTWENAARQMVEVYREDVIDAHR